MKYNLYLGSTSRNRHELLRQANIPFKQVIQSADEAVCECDQSFEEILQSIALQKMDHVIMPCGVTEGEICFVLTADTMCQGLDGTIFGKPKDFDHAREMLRALQPSGIVGTAFCLERKRFSDGMWHTDAQICQVVLSGFELIMSDAWIEKYIAAYPQLCTISGALQIDTYGMQFIKSISGSYSSILGLPMFEVRRALEELGFFD